MESISNIIKNHDHDKFTEYFNTMVQFSANPEAGIEIHSKESVRTIIPEKEVKKQYKKQYRKANEEEKEIIRQLERNTWQSIPYQKKEKITILRKIKSILSYFFK